MDNAESLPLDTDDSLRRIVVLIPALDPGPELVALVAELSALGFGQIIVVDDGSSPRCAAVWPALHVQPGVDILHLPRQQGKGAALKAGLAHLLQQSRAWDAVVTADADGQHLAVDIARVAAVRGCDVVLGARSMAAARSMIAAPSMIADGIPWRSRVGNGLTRHLFATLTGRRLRDTQTGLRRFSWSMLPQLLAVPGQRYEYELAVLLWCCRHNVPLCELETATVYAPGNPGSHFRVVRDSVRVWGALWRWWRQSRQPRSKRVPPAAGNPPPQDA